LLIALHGLRPDLDPAWHVLSEYAVGNNGWVMKLCFTALGIGCLSLATALFRYATTIGGRTGLAFLLAAALGLLMAAVFPIDPITTAPEDATMTGAMHEIASMIGVLGQIVSSLVLTYAIGGKAPWLSGRRPMLVLAHLVWIGTVLMFIALFAIMQQQSLGGPWLIGWANRLMMFAYMIWLVLAAWPLARASHP
jgi:hypothetical protein